MGTHTCHPEMSWRRHEKRNSQKGRLPRSQFQEVNFHHTLLYIKTVPPKYQDHSLVENCKPEVQRPGSHGSQQNGHHQMITHDRCQRGSSTNRPLLQCGGEWTLLTDVRRTEASQGKKQSHRIIEQLHSQSVKDKAAMHKDSCTPPLTAARFTAARTEKQQKCPSRAAGIQKLRYKHTKEQYSSQERNGIMGTHGWTSRTLYCVNTTRGGKNTV